MRRISGRGSTISIHAPRVGSDCSDFRILSGYTDFNPRSPCGERRDAATDFLRPVIISIHAPRVGSDEGVAARGCAVAISIHAPRVGSDRNLADILAHSLCISIHAPRVGSDARPRSGRKVRGYFNPRSPCGERHKTANFDAIMQNINPRSPCGERPGGDAAYIGALRISIHAPRVGSDLRMSKLGTLQRNFNPRSPCGERHVWIFPFRPHFKFQSTLPVWGATSPAKMISEPFLFQSTLPVWGATAAACADAVLALISIHAPRVGSDRPAPICRGSTRHFNPRSPCGERPQDRAPSA